MPDLAAFRALEESLHRPEIRQAPEKVRALLADGFIEFGSSGATYGKDEIIAALAQETSGAAAAIIADDFVLRVLGADTVLLTYRSLRRQPGQADRQALRSSLWQLVDGRWQMVFHQGTVIPRS